MTRVTTLLVVGSLAMALAASKTSAAKSPAQECRWNWKKMRRVCEAPTPPVRKKQPPREPDYVMCAICFMMFVGFKYCMSQSQNRRVMGIGKRRLKVTQEREVLEMMAALDDDVAADKSQ